jgi:hypothetical protein
MSRRKTDEHSYEKASDSLIGLDKAADAEPFETEEEVMEWLDAALIDLFAMIEAEEEEEEISRNNKRKT